MVFISYVCRTKKLNDMKKIGFLMMAAVALTAVSCAESTDENEEEVAGKVEAVTYTLDAANSKLMWNNDPHSGMVSISEGSIKMDGDKLASGSFKIDMNTITSTDLEEPKATYLAGHLTGNMPDDEHPVNLAFNTPAFPSVGVTLGNYSDGNLELTLDILGQELKQTVAATISADDKGASIKGAFDLDLSSLGIMLLMPDPETGEGISPSVKFDLHVALTK